jgi:hypothetical protein
VTDKMSRARPETMRDLVRDYVRAVHTTYLDHVRTLPPAERAALPLVAATTLTVVAAAARRLHLVATTDPLPTPRGPEVAVTDEHNGLTWTVRFYDPSILPELGLLTDDAPADVRRTLGVADTVYHLTVDVGGGLSGHHAQHTGVALANQHTKTTRDLDRIRRAVPGRAGLVDELGVCARNGLDRACALLAAELTAGRVVPRAGTPAASCLDAVADEVTR